MCLRDIIEIKVQKRFDPIYVEVVDESHTHRVPKGAQSHFRVLVVSSKFENQNPLERQRSLNELLRDELAGGGPIHALAQKLLTPQEWKEEEKKRTAAQWKSPDCVHKNID